MSFEIKINNSLSLKLRAVEDAEDFFMLTDKNREHLRPWLPWVDVTLSSEDTKKFIEKCKAGFEAGESADFGIQYEGVWVGSMGFHTIKRSNERAEIGYWLSKDYTGKGIMTECVKAMLAYGFRDLQLHRIQIRCDADNLPSKAIPEKLGFTLEGTVREDHKKEGRFSDGLIYGLLAHEWSGSSIL